MKIRAKHLLWMLVAAVSVTAAGFAWREIEERRMEQEEEALNNLQFDSINLKEATLEEGMRWIVEKAHAAGHPEMRMRIFKDVREAPFFHPPKKPSPYPWEPTPGASITLHLTGPIPLSEAVKYVVGLAGGGTCQVRGDTLVYVPAIGTVQEYRQKTLLLDPEFFDHFPDQALATFPEWNNVPLYEGMTIEFRRKDSEVRIFGPEEAIDSLDAMTGYSHRPSRWEEVGYSVQAWRQRILGF